MATSDRVYAILLGLISGVMVGVVATLTHRASLNGLPAGPIGVVLLIVAFVVFNRSIGGRLGLAAGVAALVGTLAVFYLSPIDLIIVDDGYGMLLAVTVTLASVIGLAWPVSRRSRFDDESTETPEPWLESPRRGN